ncbi:MAG: hypothetical protein QG646_3962 [Euryarchaeota archaeon]|nr:hypothetical protein [Euryarchaeota archaeon]
MKFPNFEKQLKIMLLKPVAENLQCIYTKVYRSLELFGFIFLLAHLNFH